MAASITRYLIVGDGVNDWKLLCPASSGDKVYITNDTDVELWVRMDWNTPAGEALPDVIVAPGMTHEEEHERWSGPIWGVIADSEVGRYVYVADFDGPVELAEVVVLAEAIRERRRTVGASLPKLEARITVPTGGWEFAITDGTRTNIPLTVPAGDYYLNTIAPDGTSSLVAQVQALLGPGYLAWVDDDTDDATGRVTIEAGGDFVIEWTDTDLRDVLGFTGAATATAAAAVGTRHALALWLPNVQRLPETPDPLDGEAFGYDFGRPEADYVVTVAPSGATTQSVFSVRRRDVLAFENVLGLKAWLAHELVLNESLERFWLTVMAAGGVPFRYHSNRADDAIYWSMIWDGDAGELRPVPIVPGWVGERSLWRVVFQVRKYLEIEGELA